MNKHSYKTIRKKAEALFKDRNSKFFAYAFEVNGEDEIKSALEELSTKHHKARHVCYAYRFGEKAEFYRINDDGEPSGSAGMPIYNQLLSRELNHVLVAVVRYFGGTKLGVPGLINAYGESAAMALDEAGVKTVIPQTKIEIAVDYGLMGKLMEELKSIEGFEIISQDFTNQAIIITQVDKGKEDLLVQSLKCRMAGVPFDKEREVEVEGVEVRF
ncbi:MAG: YigZ family protein [Saprospirales bacterium]|nr:MAG: YigZ family protein [Saprospirales bacterium]